jgi:hypothetical protein
MTGGADRFAILQLDAMNPFGDQHVAPGQLPDHRRHAEIRLRADILRQLRIGGRLQAQIHLQRNGALQDVDDCDWLEAAGLRCIALNEAGSGIECAQVAGEAAADAWPQHLDGEIAGALRGPLHGLVDLGDGGGGERLGEAIENGLNRPADRRLDYGAGLRGGKRRNIILQPAQGIGGLHADDIRAGGEELAKLDVGRPEPVEGLRQAPAALGRCEPARLQRTREAHRAPRLRRQVLGVGKSEYAGARQDQPGAAQLKEAADAQLRSPTLRFSTRNAARRYRRRSCCS